MNSVMKPQETGHEIHVSRAPVVLLVEDQAGLRDILTYALEIEGVDVIECADCESAVNYLHLARTSPRALAEGVLPLPDLMLTDMILPDGTGFELLREVIGISGIDVITMTAYGDPELHDLARRMGARRSFDKPFALGELMAAIRSSTGW